MRTSLIVMVFLSTSLISVFGQGNSRQKTLNAADEFAIRDLIQKCAVGWNKGSGEAFAAQFAEDADFVVVNGMHIKGRRQNAAAHQQIFDTFYRGTRLWIQITSVRFLRADISLVHTISRVLKPEESGASPAPENIQTWTISKHGHAWLVDAFQNTSIQRQEGQVSKP